MYLSTRMQRGLSVSARTSPTTSGGSRRQAGAVIACGSRTWTASVAPRKGLSYLLKTADRQQIKNGSDGLRTMKSIKSSTSTNARSRTHAERGSSYATHPSRQVCAPAYGPDARQMFHCHFPPVRFIRYLRSPALVRLPLVQCQRPPSFSSRPLCWPLYGRTMPTPTKRQFVASPYPSWPHNKKESK